MLKQKREALLFVENPDLIFNKQKLNKPDHKEDQEKWQRKLNLEEAHVPLPGCMTQHFI